MLYILSQFGCKKIRYSCRIDHDHGQLKTCTKRSKARRGTCEVMAAVIDHCSTQHTKHNLYVTVDPYRNFKIFTKPSRDFYG